MALKIRLTRKGAKKQPYYRIVVADSRSPRDGGFIEQVGTYNPRGETDKVNIKTEILQKWLSQGALPSETVLSLIKAAGLVGK